jgi:glycosyltransferase involved in cell wall biosynthesis
MRVAIDATSIPSRPAGAGVYAIELIRAMMERDPRDGYAVFTRGPWFDDAAHERRNWRVHHVSAASRQARLFWEQARLPGIVARLGIDVLHSTHHTLPLRPMRAKRVVTVHDVTFFRLPERYPPARRMYMQTMTRLSARIADAIIAPSNAVREDVVRALRVDPAKITVVYEAAAERYRPLPPGECASVRARYGVEAPYVLSVGSREPGKNRERLIRAMRELRDAGTDRRLLVVGQPAWKYEGEEALVDSLRMSDRVIFAGYVPDGDLPALYSACDAFAFPSLYEGFGVPVLEAMACGAPVVTSDVSATAEVAGNAAVLVDPHSVASIRDGMRRVLTDDGLRRDLATFGKARAAQFSWRRAADETYAVYERVMRK